MKKSWQLDRRTILRGAGVAMALPLLEAMSFGAVDPAKSRPRRMVCAFFPNGVSLPPDPEKRDLYWFPEGEGRQYQLTKPLEPLSPFREDVTIVEGLEHFNSRGLHGHNAPDIWLTGADIRRSYKNSISVDQVAANALGPETRLPSLVLSPEGGVGNRANANTMSFNKRGLPIPSENDPRRIFERMFTEESASSVDTQRQHYQRQRSMLDRVLEDARSLQHKLGSADKEKLAQYLDSVREIEQRIERTEGWLNRPKPQVSTDMIRLDLDVAEPAEFMRTYYSLILLALQTDTTRVATYQIARERGHNNTGDQLSLALGIGGWHNVSHSAEQENGWENWAKLDRFTAEQFAWFLGRLKSIAEGDGNLLDHTVILYGCTSSKTHTALNYPTVLAGGDKLGLKHGQFLKYGKETPFSNVLYTMLRRMNLPKPPESFADSTGELAEVVA
ncbi:DUF1552 domain-containing protein [Lignipirellula cremea]|uniref:DUF1552 domain-containing protein n=1 Tax=Lignipirellula cremea TaxID=2528010 RepID=A0A518DKG4_9BACT|nr:DUF1552 domain-containing protein [Lignipirellula cremea]QDU92325.1 hypothetical protein Pla8534_00700 [Lignipirellula cremea]